MSWNREQVRKVLPTQIVDKAVSRHASIAARKNMLSKHSSKIKQSNKNSVPEIQNKKRSDKLQ